MGPVECLATPAIDSVPYNCTDGFIGARIVDIMCMHQDSNVTMWTVKSGLKQFDSVRYIQATTLRRTMQSDAVISDTPDW